ncbi:MAG TPA: toll/interleukin-1 receptor domain-containing protein [Pyrinomonadaceae bacterium]|nr:toll/interleukin-1 receptor domain-containing protein [Pyrinomonadaceae bacterium]
MAYVPNFANDIFISFAHADNRGGWVKEFNTRLEDRLGEIGAPVEIWRDSKLHGTDVFSDEIFDQLKDTAVLISIVTPSSIRSNWCQDERQKFEQFAATNGGFRIGNVLRAVKVTKTPLDGDAHRGIFGTLGFEFYERDPQTKRFHEFDFSSPKFNAKLDELAQDLKRVLDVIRTHHRPAKKPTIYIATTTSDLAPRREAVVQQVLDWGYQVHPAGDLPTDPASFRSTVEAALAESILSVHLLSDNRGLILEGEELSVIALQYELAKARGLDRIAWVLPEKQPHPSVAGSLQGDLREGFVLLEGRSIEDLKEEIEAKLKRLSGEVELVDKESKRNIYLVCDRKDHPYVETAPEHEQILKLISYLDSQGFVVWLPPVNVAEEKQRRRDHRETLKLSDAAVLYWGQSDEGWFRENLRELTKARRARSSRRSLTVGIYFSPPPLNEKAQYRRHPGLVLEQSGDFSPEILSPLLRSLQT